MQGKNILGEKKRPKLVLLVGLVVLMKTAQDRPGGLAADRRRRSGPKRVENRLRNVGEKRGRKRVDGLSLPAVADKRSSVARVPRKNV